MLHLSLIIEMEDDGISQFFLVWTQRAYIVAESLREHRNGAIHEVNAGSSLACFLVYDASFGDIVAHIGDMYAHFPQSIIEFAYAQSIVKVLSIMRVDGAGEDITEVFALSIVLLGNLIADFLSGFLHCFRVFIRQTVLCEDGIHLRIIVALLAEDVDYASHNGFMLSVRPVDYLHHHAVAVLCILYLTLRDDDILRHRFGRNDEGEILLHLESAYKLVLCTLEYLDDLRLAYMLLTTCHEAYTHTVVGECAHRVALSHEDRLVRAVRNE